MRARLILLPLILAAVVFVPAAQTARGPNRSAAPAARSAVLAAPAGLRAFVLRADEPSVTVFSRTPAFVWSPYYGATGYDFQLATSRTFDDRTVVWSTDSRSIPLKVPAATVPIALPWMTGNPFALWARVRAATPQGTTRWSAPFGFNMEAGGVPERLAPDIPGLVRWRPVESATAYEVWFWSPKSAHSKIISTTTNVADMREVYALQDPEETEVVRWRVRGVRQLYGSGTLNGLPITSYGPWSEAFTSIAAPAHTADPLRLLESVSDTITTGGGVPPHNLTPGFVWTGTDYVAGAPVGLYRVYVASDRQCVNIVYTGSVVASSAYAPRTTGPLVLEDNASTTTPTTTTTATTTTTPTTTTTTTTTTPTTTAALPDFPKDGTQSTLNVMGEQVTPNESGGSTASTKSPTTTDGSSTIPAEFTTDGPFIDLWDLGRPSARYWWTVVPVIKDGSNYQDAALPQDLCAAGRVAELTRTSKPVVISETAKPFVSGLSGPGTLVAAASVKPSLYRGALISWVPAAGAIGYEVQWSKKSSPWKAALAPAYTAATSLLVDTLAPGTWYYRVRGIDPYVPGPVKQMSWSAPVGIKITKPRFSVESGVTVRPAKKKK